MSMESNVLPSNASPLGSDLSTTPVVRKIRRIGVGSAFRVGALVSGLIWAIVGIFFVLFSLAGAGIMAAFGAPGAEAGMGFVGVLIFYIVMLVVYAIFGGIFGALYAWLYNVVAGWVGGIEIQLTAD